MDEPADDFAEHVALSRDQEYFLEAWPRQIEQSVIRLGDALNRLITLGTGMAGGALVFLKDDVCTGWGRVLAAVLFFLALAAAVYGAVPVRLVVYQDADAIRESMIEAADVKRKWVVASTAFLLAGILAAIAGAAVRASGG